MAAPVGGGALVPRNQVQFEDGDLVMDEIRVELERRIDATAEVSKQVLKGAAHASSTTGSAIAPVAANRSVTANYGPAAGQSAQFVVHESSVAAQPVLRRVGDQAIDSSVGGVSNAAKQIVDRALPE